MIVDTIKDVRKYIFISCISPAIAKGVSSMREGSYSLLRKRTLNNHAETQIVVDAFMKSQIENIRNDIYMAVASDVHCRSFFNFQRIDEKKASRFRKLIILMLLMELSDDDIACYLFTDKSSVRTSKSLLKKVYPDLLSTKK